MNSTNNMVRSAQLAMTDVLQRNIGHVLIAGGGRARGPAAYDWTVAHHFHVCSLDRLAEVKVFMQSERAPGFRVIVRSVGPKRDPSAEYRLTEGAGGVWSWHRGDVEVPAGLWRLEVSGNNTDECAWSYQVWAASPLRAHLSALQGVATGAPIHASLAWDGALVQDIRCEAFVTRPHAALDRLVVEHHVKVADALRAQLQQHWPLQPERPWWLLGPVHKLAALRSANIDVPAELRTTRERVECRLGKDRAELEIAGTDTTVPGTYQLLARMVGRVRPDDVFERVVYRQVFVAPEPDEQAVVAQVRRTLGTRPITVLQLALKDRFGNPVLGGTQALELRWAGGLRGVKSRPISRDDGTFEWELMDVPEGRANLSFELLNRGRRVFLGRRLPFGG